MCFKLGAMKTSLPLALLAFAVLGFAPVAVAADPLPTDVVLFEHGKVASTFEKGGALLSNDLYKVQAGRREKPGAVEVHAHDTDVFYILDGTATFVTGGKCVGAHEVSPGETRGTSIEGGSERHLAKGDVIVIPNGIPHQFTQVDAPFLYFVVKVTR